MRNILITALMAPVASFATDLIVFEANKPAVARDVNTNFSRLDSAIQGRPTKADLGSTDGLLKSALNSISQLQTGKADQNGVDKALAAKADQALVDKSLGAKADSSALGDLARKQRADSAALGNALKSTLTAASLGGIRDTLRLKADTAVFHAFKRQTESALTGKQAVLGFTPLSAGGGTVSGDLAISKGLTVGSAVSAGGFKTGGDVSALRGRFDTLVVPGALLAQYPSGNAGAIYADQVGAPGSENYSLAWLRDGSAAYLRAGAKYLGVRVNETAPVYNDGVAERSVWHSGNLDPNGFQRVGGEKGLDAFTEANPTAGFWQFDCHCGSGPSGNAPINSLNIQVFSTGNSTRGMQLAGAYDSDSYFLRRGNGDWTPWVSLVHSGNIGTYAVANTGGSIDGNLHVSGTLTTAPGATPADYVFEPDYKLAPLAEVEAYTKENRHLPEVPSAKEMTSQGVDLAKMNMVLLKKVEELTLHAIAQEKRLDQQEKLIDQLRNERSVR